MSECDCVRKPLPQISAIFALWPCCCPGGVWATLAEHGPPQGRQGLCYLAPRAAALHWVPVLSTEMSHTRHDPDSGALHVRFLSGEVYEHYGVSRRAYDMLLATPSKGKYNFARVR